MTNSSSYPKKGDVLMVRLDPVLGSEQGGTRPAVVIQNNESNQHSPIIIVAAISSRKHKGYVTDVVIPQGSVEGLPQESIIVGNQLRSIDKSRIIKHLGTLPKHMIPALKRALTISLHLIDF